MAEGIRYCATSDGVRIAYTTIGNGRPLVFLVPYPGSIELEDRLPAVRAFYDGLIPGHTLIRFDLRGTGASQRDVNDFSVAARARDVEALVEHLELAEFDMFAGPGTEAHTAVQYCSRNPGRVARLILWEPTAAVRPSSSPVARAQRVLVMSDWQGISGVLGSDFVRGWPEEDRKTMRRLYRETLTPETLISLNDVSSDVSELLPALAVTTLVLHARRDRQFSIDASRVVAALIPDAKLVTIDADHAYFFSFHEQIVPRVREFLGDEPTWRQVTTPGGGISTVLFTDLVGHTEMMRSLGDERGRGVLREHERITRDVLKRHGGAEIKTMGDGFMASFRSVTKAVDCAIALQRAFHGWNVERGASGGAELRVRVGLNAGEPIEEDGDLFGSTVIMASRIAAIAGTGEILIPEPLRHLLSGKSYSYADRGEAMLKGFEDAVRLYEVRWQL